MSVCLSRQANPRQFHSPPKPASQPASERANLVADHGLGLGGESVSGPLGVGLEPALGGLLPLLGLLLQLHEVRVRGEEGQGLAAELVNGLEVMHTSAEEKNTPKHLPRRGTEQKDIK